MKQLLLRVPDDVHRRLAAKASLRGSSINSLATEILDAAVGPVTDPGRRGRLRVRALAAGVSRSAPAAGVDPERYQRAVESMRGVGPVIDRLLDEERSR